MTMRQTGLLLMTTVLLLFQNCSNQIQSDHNSNRIIAASADAAVAAEVPGLRTVENRPVVVPREAYVVPTPPVSSVRQPPVVNSRPEVPPAAPSAPPAIPPSTATPYELGALIGTKLDSLIGRAQVVVASSDAGKTGYFLFVLNFNNQFYILDPDGDKWLLWDRRLNNYVTPLMNLNSTVGSGLLLMHSLDVTAFGGAVLSVGYGVGNNIVSAVDECFTNGRLKEIQTLEIQKFLGLVSIPRFDPTSEKIVNVQYIIRPQRDDYWLSGFYYVFAISPEGQKLFFTGNAWINSETTASDTWHYSRVDALENLVIKQRVVSKDLAIYKGWKMFVGYGRNYQDMITRNLISRVVVVP